MNYTQLQNALENFKDYISLEILKDPVYFSDHLGEMKSLYSEAMLQDKFARTNQLVEIHDADPHFLDEDQLNELRVKGQVNQFYAKDQTRCDVSNRVLQKNNMKDCVLFRNVFLVAVKNAILNNPEMFVTNDRPRVLQEDAKTVLEFIETLSFEQVLQAEKSLDNMLEKGNAHGLEDWQVKALINSGISLQDKTLYHGIYRFAAVTEIISENVLEFNDQLQPALEPNPLPRVVPVPQQQVIAVLAPQPRVQEPALELDQDLRAVLDQSLLAFYQMQEEQAVDFGHYNGPALHFALQPRVVLPHDYGVVQEMEEEEILNSVLALSRLEQ